MSRSSVDQEISSRPRTCSTELTNILIFTVVLISQTPPLSLSLKSTHSTTPARPRNHHRQPTPPQAYASADPQQGSHPAS